MEGRYSGYEYRLWSPTGFELDGFLKLSVLWSPVWWNGDIHGLYLAGRLVASMSQAVMCLEQPLTHKSSVNIASC